MAGVCIRSVDCHWKDMEIEVIDLKQQRAADSVNEFAALKGEDWAGTVKNNDKFHKVCRKEFVKEDRIPLVVETGKMLNVGPSFPQHHQVDSQSGNSIMLFVVFYAAK